MSKKKNGYSFMTESDRKIRRMKRTIIILIVVAAVLAGALAFILSSYILIPRIVIPV